ncbi:hypothetical protein OROMI_024367 [Orobanche minor]
MLFTNKFHLQSCVDDYSIRHAYRAYKVEESTTSIFKVVCKLNAVVDCPKIASGRRV